MLSLTMICGVFLDIAGVLYQGDKALPGAADAVARLRRAGFPVRFLTNSTRQPKRRVLQKLASFGIDADPAELLTPVAAVRNWLKARGYAPHLLVHPNLEEDFAGCPAAGPEAVVVGDAGRYFTYGRMNAAFRKIEAGAPLLALAENRVFKDDDGQLSLDAGAFVRALEYATGQTARLFGKPAAEFFRAGTEDMGCDPAEVVMIGDDAESDVAGALAAGLGMAILIRTGKYRAGDEAQCDPQPTLVAENVAAAVNHVLNGR